MWQSDKMTSPTGPSDVRFATDRATRARLWWEIGIVLAVTVGQSALYSVLSLVRASLRTDADRSAADAAEPESGCRDPLERAVPVPGHRVRPGSGRPGRVPDVGARPERPATHRARLHATSAATWAAASCSPPSSAYPGLGLYAVVAAAGAQRRGGRPLRWMPRGGRCRCCCSPQLRAGLTEEVIFIAYLFDRLRRLGWSWWAIILSTAALRGAYHAYQGVGAIVGNFVMGVVFGWCYRRWGRVMPLVIAHTLLDIVAFVGLSPGRRALARRLRPRAFAHRNPDSDPDPDPVAPASVPDRPFPRDRIGAARLRSTQSVSWRLSGLTVSGGESADPSTGPRARDHMSTDSRSDARSTAAPRVTLAS